MKVGGEPLQQEFNRGYDYIINTFGAAENTIDSKNIVSLMVRGIVIDIDFNITKNYRLAAAEPPFSIYAKIIGEDLDVGDPTTQAEKIFYSPFLPIHNLSVPEIGEEILIMRESSSPTSKGYYIGRVCNNSTLNYYPARQYMDSIESVPISPEFKYGFTFDVNKLRDRRISETPSDDIKAISIPITFGDVVQQGRSQSYIRHSFNRNNKKGVLEQGLRLQRQNVKHNINNDINTGSLTSYDPSIGETATKSIHFVDTSIKRLGDYNFSSILPNDFDQANPNSFIDKSMIANVADEIYNISLKELESTLYRQVLGEKLISHQQETNVLMQTMLNGLTGLAETVQVLLNAFVEHEHALPKIELNLEKEIKTKDLYRTPVRVIPQAPRMVWVRKPGWNKVPRAAKTVNVPGYFDHYAPDGGAWIPAATKSVPAGFDWKRDPGVGVRVPTPPKVIPGRMRSRNVKQKINFEAIIGGEENPRFTAPIETDRGTPTVNPLAGDLSNTQAGREALEPESLRNINKTELGMKTAQVNTDTENLIDLFNKQKEDLNTIFNKATNFLSRNQFIN